MLLHKLFIGAAFAGAIAVTALFTSFAASSANAEGAGMINEPIPNYVLRWENPLLPPTPVRSVFGP